MTPNERGAKVASLTDPLTRPVMYTVLLSRYRHILSIPRENRTEAQRKAVAHLGFLANTYKEEFW